MKPEDIRSIPLPAPLLNSIENPFSDIRLGAVNQLTRLMNGKNLGMARSAKEALERIAKEDDSRQVQRAAAQALGAIRQAAQLAIQEEAEEAQLPALQKEGSARFETPNATLPQGLSTTILWFTLVWAFAGGVGGFVYNAFDNEIAGEAIAGAIGGAIGGLVTALTPGIGNVQSRQKNIVWVTLAWAIGGGTRLVDWLGAHRGNRCRNWDGSLCIHRDVKHSRYGPYSFPLEKHRRDRAGLGN